MFWLTHQNTAQDKPRGYPSSPLCSSTAKSTLYIRASAPPMVLFQLYVSYTAVCSPPKMPRWGQEIWKGSNDLQVPFLWGGAALRDRNVRTMDLFDAIPWALNSEGATSFHGRVIVFNCNIASLQAVTPNQSVMTQSSLCTFGNGLRVFSLGIRCCV